MKMFGMSSCGGHKEEANEKETQTNDGSQYSLTGIYLPSLGATDAQGNQRPKLCRFIISPYNHHYR